MSAFLSSPLPSILHVRPLVGAAGLQPNSGLEHPSRKVLGRHTSSDLQLGAHTMPLLLWAIKGKWERDDQIPLAILTYILSNRVAAWTDYKHMLKRGKTFQVPTDSSFEGQMEGSDSDNISCWPAPAYIDQSIPSLYFCTTLAPQPCLASNHIKNFLRCLRHEHLGT